jgi:hypothetical protein
VEPGGALTYVADDAVVLASLKAPAGMRGLKGAAVVTAPSVDGGTAQKTLGTLTRVDAAFLANGGEFVIAAGELKGVGDAIVVASKADLLAGVAEGVLVAGAPVPVAAPTEKSFGKTIKSLSILVREEALWAPAPPGGGSAPPDPAPPGPPAPAPPAPAPPAPAPAPVDAGPAGSHP